MQYLEENKGAFKLILDYARLRIQAQLYFVHVIGRETDEAKNTLKSVILELLKIVKSNFDGVKKEFYSILDMHELLISLVTEWMTQNNTIPADLKSNTGGKLVLLFEEARSKTPTEKAFDFSDIEIEEFGEAFL